MEDLKLDIPSETLTKLKTIYEDAQKAKNNELAEKIWSEFYDIIDQFFKPQPFEEYIAIYNDFEISEADKKQLKQLYEEAIKLDKKEEAEKIRENWEAFHNILGLYFKANKEILISPSKLTVNGQDYLPQ